MGSPPAQLSLRHRSAVSTQGLNIIGCAKLRLRKAAEVGGMLLREPARRDGYFQWRKRLRCHLIEIVLAIFVPGSDLNAAARQCLPKKYLDFSIDAP